MKFGNLSFVGFLLCASSMSFADSSACHFPQYNLCYDAPTINLEDECLKENGLMMELCPTANRFGTCKVLTFGHIVYVRYYTGFNPDEAKKSCLEMNGGYTGN